MNVFEKQAGQYLESVGFTRIENSYVKSEEIETKAGTLIINGQAIEQPTQKIKTEVFVRFMNEGSVKDSVTGQEDVFEQVEIEIFCGERFTHVEECIYLNEVDLFKEIINFYLNHIQ